MEEEIRSLDDDNDHSVAIEKINKDYDFDNPDAIEFELLVEGLKELKKNNSFSMPKYNKKTKMREEKWVKVHPSDVIIVEGHLAFAYKEL